MSLTVLSTCFKHNDDQAHKIVDQYKEIAIINRELTERNKYLETQLEEAKMELSQHNLEWDDIVLKGLGENNLEQNQQQIKSLLKDLKDKNEELKSIKQELHEKNRLQMQVVPNLEQAVPVATEKNELSILIAENEKLLQEKRMLLETKERLNNKISYLEEQNLKVITEIDNYKEVVTNSRETSKNTENELISRTNELEELKRVNEELRIKIKQIEEDHDLLTDQADDVTNLKDTLDLNLKEKTKYLENIELNLTEATKKLVELEIELESERFMRQNVEKEITSYKERLDKYEMTKNDSQVNILNLQKEIKELKMIESNYLKITWL